MSLDTEKIPEIEEENEKIAENILDILKKQNSGKKALRYYNQLGEDIKKKFEKSEYSWVLKAASFGSI